MAKIDYTGATNLEIATYSGSSCITVTAATSNVTWLTVTSFNNGSIKANVSANTSDSGRTAQITVGYKADENPCSKTFSAEQGMNECTCGDMRVSPTAISWSSSDVSNKQITLTPSSCINSITASNNNTTDFTMTRNGNIITVKPNGENPSATTPKTGIITVSYSAGTTIGCSSAVTITQQPVGCNCENLTVSPTSMSWAYDETGDKTVTIDADPCVNITSVVIDEGDTTAFTASYDASTNKVTVSPVDQNPGQTPYDAKLRVYYLDDCDKSVDLYQGIMGCSCNDLDFITPTSLSWGSGETQTKTVEYSADTCVTVTNISHTNTSDFAISLDRTNKIVSVTPTSVNQSSAERTDVITLSYNAGGSCPDKTIHATQDPHICGCEDITWTILTTNIDMEGSPSTGDVIANYDFGECDGNIISVTATSTTPGEDWIKALPFDNGNIIVSGAPNPTLSNDRSGVVTITYKPNVNTSTPCTKEIQVNQTSVPCGCEHVDEYITPIHLVFGSGGTHGERILVASGDTHGCGYLSANTSSSQMLVGGGLQVEPINGSYERVNFYAQVSNYTDTVNLRSVGAGITFKSKDEGSLYCDSGSSTVLYQYNSAIASSACSDFVIEPYTVSVTGCNENTIYGKRIATLKPKYQDIILDSDVMDIVCTTPSVAYHWLTFEKSIGTNETDVWLRHVDANINDAASARTADLSFIIVNKKNSWYCQGSTAYAKVIQSGCSLADCSCENYVISDYLQGALSGISSAGESIDLSAYISSLDGLECANPALSAYTLSVSIPQSASSWVSFDYGANGHPILQVNEVPSTSSIPKRETDIEIQLDVNGSPCQTVTRVVEQNGPCSCANFSYRIEASPGGTYIRENDGVWKIDGCYSGGTLVVYSSAIGISDCVSRIGLQNPPSWVHLDPPTPSSYANRLYLTFDENDTGSARTGNFDIIVFGKNEGTPQPICFRYTTIQQQPTVCDCYFNDNNSKQYTDKVYPDDYVEVAYIDIPDDPCGCLSFSAYSESGIIDVEAAKPYATSSYFYVSGKTSDSYYANSCDEEITIDLINNKTGQVCATKTIPVKVEGCYKELPTQSVGTLTVTGGTYQMVQGQQIQVATVTNSGFGNGRASCWTISAQTDSDEEIPSFVVEHTGNNFNVSIVLGRFKDGDSEAHPSVDIIALRTDPCDGSTSGVTLRTIDNLNLI